MNWTPINREELTGLISAATADLDAPSRRFWELICVPPAKWKLSPWGDLGGGFWIVAILGTNVIWYNDIEDGFNISRFDTVGVIAEYFCNHDELQHSVHSLRRYIETGTIAQRLGPPHPLT
jgi:hypothetical protein